MKKGEPNNRSWKLAHVAVQQMLAEAETDSRVADMNRMLAFRTLKQTSVENASDLRFLTQLYLRQGQGKEVLTFFETLKTQDSAVAKQAFDDWQFARQRIDLSIGQSNWDELLALCRSLLGLENMEASNGDSVQKLIIKDDWKVWKGLVQACDKLGKLDEFPLYKEGSELPWKEKRQHMIATLWVTLLLEQKAAADAADTASYAQTVQLAKGYFTTWQTYPFCYDDIKDFVIQLPPSAQTEIRQGCEVSPQKLSKIETNGDADSRSKKHAEWLTAEVNALKFEYLLGCGIASNAQADTIRRFACNAIRLVELCHQSKQRTADATYLAVSALIRLYEIEKDVTALFQAAYLLESGPAPEDAHPGKVMLVYIESEIGLLSMAMKQYKSLRVREIQYETMAHMQLSRISISHPFAVEQKRQEPVDPSRIIDEGLDVFLSSDQKLASAQVKLFEQGKCDLIFELQDLRNSLAHSMNRRMLVLEQARIARLTDDVPAPRIFEVRPRVPEHWTQNIKDSRDYAETFNYDSVTRDDYPERRLQAGGKIPKNRWLRTAILAEDVWALLSNRDTVCVLPSTPISPDETVDSAELTDMEAALIDPWNTLLQATQSLLSPTKDAQALQSRVEALKETLSTRLPLQKLTTYKPVAGLPSSTAHLQGHFLLLDYLRTCALFVQTASQIASKKRIGQAIPSTPLAGLKDATKKAYESVRKTAEKARKDVDARDIVQAMRKGAVGDAISEAESLNKGLRVFADRAEASARDAWEGVLKVRLG